LQERACAIGVDLGGQSLKLATVDKNGVCHHARQVPVNSEYSADEMTDWLAKQITAQLAETRKHGWSIRGIGMVLPGYMNRQRTRILFAANLAGLNDTDLPEKLAARFELPMGFDADCNGAAMAEYRFGAGRGSQRLTVVTVGTGIGAGVIFDGKLVRNFGHAAGSLGHIIVDPQGQRCSCGGRGCLETKASGRALERLAEQAVSVQSSGMLARLKEEAGRLTGAEVNCALQQGDEVARQIVESIGWWLGAGLATWSAIYKPETIIIGGKVAELGSAYLQAIRRGLTDVGQPFLVNEITVASAALGTQAGVIGAASIFLAQNKA